MKAAYAFVQSLFAIGLTLLAFATAPAAAQLAGSRLNKVADHKDVGKVMDEFVGCLADIEDRWSRAFLETLPGSLGEKEIVEQINGERFSRCLIGDKLSMANRTLGMSGKALRGALAAHYVRTSLGSRTATEAVPGGASAWLTAKLAARPPGEPLDRPILIAHDFAACLVDRDWVAARAFAATAVGTPNERAALRRLAGNFSPCMQQGAKMRLDAALLRVTISEALYHSLNATMTADTPQSASAK